MLPEEVVETELMSACASICGDTGQMRPLRSHRGVRTQRTQVSVSAASAALMVLTENVSCTVRSSYQTGVPDGEAVVAADVETEAPCLHPCHDGIVRELVGAA